MKDIFEEVGISVNPVNKKQIDHASHQIVGVGYKDCPTTWESVKQTFLSDEQKRREFIQKLQAAIH
jgi:hypothetical protein